MAPTICLNQINRDQPRKFEARNPKFETVPKSQNLIFQTTGFGFRLFDIRIFLSVHPVTRLLVLDRGPASQPVASDRQPDATSQRTVAN
jgi:hypothetical protein